MKKVFLVMLISALIGCQSEQAKSKHLAQLACDSSREGRSHEELQAIGDACFRHGKFIKSSGKAW